MSIQPQSPQPLGGRWGGSGGQSFQGTQGHYYNGQSVPTNINPPRPIKSGYPDISSGGAMPAPEHLRVYNYPPASYCNHWQPAGQGQGQSFGQVGQPFGQGGQGNRQGQSFGQVGQPFVQGGQGGQPFGQGGQGGQPFGQGGLGGQPFEHGGQGRQGNRQGQPFGQGNGQGQAQTQSKGQGQGQGQGQGKGHGGRKR